MIAKAQSAKPLPKFFTERLPLASYLLATGRLRFLGCEHCSGDLVQFVFADPEEQAPAVELEFDGGATAPASALFSAQKILRRAIDAAKLGAFCVPRHRK